MKRSARSLLFFLPCFLLSGIFSVMSPGIDAFADNELQINKLSALTTRGFYGDTLSCNYSVNGVRYSADLTLFGSVYSESSGSGGGGRGVWSGINADPNSFFTSSYQDYDVLLYATEPIGFYTLEDVTIYGCDTYFDEYARGCFAASVNNGLKNNPVNNNNLISAYPDNYFDSFHAISANYSASSNLVDYYGVSTIFFNNDYNIGLRMIPYEFINGGSVQSIHFDSVGTGSYGHFIFAIICPYVGGSMVNRPPVTETTTTNSVSTTTDINVNVDVDLTETNGILSGIKQSIDNLVQAILNGLKVLFIPSDDFMDDFKDDMQDLLEDHLGGLYEAEQIMVDSFEQLPEVAAKSEIYIPPAQLPLGGETFTVGGWHVPLKVSGLPSALYEGIAFIIDFLCIAAFLRMCRNKLEIFLNPDSEVIQQ